ncbi:hypothetical protein DUNSADRAFT_18545 [Dunaliella salina]|uniref:Encoded protein n=1 Tax=Dunaliella salina TaxID=3046 RepID=A0ABQ7FZY1_DUNSA|nr:hypothetical protein DUNSADRAFT_18545 [Dunaliella salina]|eukprot:KAF5827905.1 hypothetical protein DUNSADRAFT_18545 [Dunaliella salina]
MFISRPDLTGCMLSFNRSISSQAPGSIIMAMIQNSVHEFTQWRRGHEIAQPRQTNAWTQRFKSRIKFWAISESKLERKEEC